MLLPMRAIRSCWLPIAFWTTLGHATAPAEGRWEGEVRIPGAPLTLIVDLAQDERSTWTGSVVMPGMGLKGAPLGDIEVAGAAVRFTFAGALQMGGAAPPRVEARLTDSDTMAGDFEQAGLKASLVLKRVGPPQVDPAPKSTPVAKALEGAWSGSFELGGYPRNVTLTLLNRPAAPASGRLVIVGKKTTQVPLDLVVQEGDFLRLEARQIGITFEGRWREPDRKIEGSFQLGTFDLPTVLSRGAAGAGGGS